MQVQCPKCHTILEASPDVIGQPATCAQCGNSFRIPSSGTLSSSHANANARLAKCPYCGHSINSMSGSPENNVQLIELTSKYLKKRKALWLILIFVFMVLIALTLGCSPLFISRGSVDMPWWTISILCIWGMGFIISFIGFCRVKFLIWWHHG